MKITSLTVPDYISDGVGLKAIKMDRLQNVVVVAGPNGAGKTRFLNLLYETFNKRLSFRDDKFEKDTESLEEEYNRLLANIDSSETDIELKTKRRLEILKDRHPITYDRMLYKMFKESVIEPPFVDGGVVGFFPKAVGLIDTYSLSDYDIDQNELSLDKIGTAHIEVGVIAKIKRVTHRFIAATNGTSKNKIGEKDIQKYISDFYRLSSVIEQYLGVPLEYDENLHPTLFGKRIGVANLSQGQTVLLQLCLALFTQSSRLGDNVLLIDEPENHLYPKALLDAIDKIIENIGNGQVIIATHSIHILAHFDPTCIWYIDRGEIKYAGNIPKTVLSGLLGSEEERIRLASFLSLPEVVAVNQFSYECLLSPKVLMTSHNDPQAKQAHEILQQLMLLEKQINVLEFGIGQGRLLATINELEKQEGRDVAQWLNYYGYDICDEYKASCEVLFKNVYGDDKIRYFNEKTKMLSHLDQGDLDLIIMCNVLHEINPKDWISLFTSSNSIFSLLKPAGCLLIIEDQLLPVGEMAHANGFLVLDSPQIKLLFKIKSSEGYYYRQHDNKGRLKAHFIPAANVVNIDNESRNKAILSVKEHAMDQIKRIRQLNNGSFQMGREYAFYTHQLANASIIMDELGVLRNQ